MRVNFVQNQPPQSDGNGKTTLEKGGRDPPAFTLDYIFNDLLSYIGGSPHLNETYKNIEEKYTIKKERDSYWPEDGIKQAWGKTQRMDRTSLKRKRWSLAIMLQVIKRQHFNECIGKEAQPDQSNIGNSSQSSEEKNVDDTPDPMKAKKKGSNKQTVYIRIPISVMFKNELTSQRGGKSKEKDSPTYKLIDRFPFLHEIKKKKSYVMLYNNCTRNAAWVYEILNRDTLLLNDKNEGDPTDPLNEAAGNLAVTQSRNRKDLKYKDDTIDPLHEAAKNIEECNESDYGRGHLAAAANHKWCQEAYDDTFFLSNIAPQVPAFNQDLWRKLEVHCQNKIKNQNEICNVHVYSGPLYLLSDKKRGKKLKIWRSKVVPTHFFKVIISEYNDGTVKLECFEMPNEKPKDKNDQSNDKNNKSKNKNNQSKDKNNQSKDNVNLETYRVSIKQIETDSGLRFTESSCIEGAIDSKRKVIWEGRDANEKSRNAKIKVTISTPLTDHNDFVYI